MRVHWAKSLTLAACVVAGQTVRGGDSGQLDAMSQLGSVGPHNYGPVQPPSWGDRVGATLLKPFQAATAAFHPKPQTPPDQLSLSRGYGSVTPELCTALAGISERTGDVGQARHQYRQALAMNPRQLDAVLGLARLEDRANQFDEALRCYRQAAALAPNDAVVANDFGLCLARCGRVRESLDPLGHAVRVEPQKALYRNNIAKVLVALNRPADAASHLAAVSDPATVNYNMAVLLVEFDRLEEAAACLRQATTLNPNFTEANALLAELTGTDAELVADDANDAEVRTAQRGSAVRHAPSHETAPAVQTWPASQPTDDEDEQVLPTPGETPSMSAPEPTSDPILLPPIE